MKDVRGQSLIEYILLVAAVVLVCIYFFSTNGPMSQSVNSALNGIVNQINTINGDIQFQ